MLCVYAISHWQCVDTLASFIMINLCVQSFIRSLTLSDHFLFNRFINNLPARVL